MATQSDRTVKEILTEAQEAELEKNIERTVSLYDEVLTIDRLNEVAYNRLMILYRNQKEYKKELRAIKEGITIFENFYKSKAPKKSKTITAISTKLNKSFGLSDKKGNRLYDPEPIATWKKRKLIVEKKMKKS